MDEVVENCRRTWRRLGVRPSEIDAMTAELRSDLEAASADGLDPQAYLGGDASGVARAWASSRGLVRPRYRVFGVMAVTFFVTIPTLFAASFIYVAITSTYIADLFNPGWDQFPVCDGGAYGNLHGSPYTAVPLWLFVLWYLVATAAGFAAVLLAVGAYLRRWADAAREKTVRTMAFTFWPAVVVAVLSATAVSYGLGGYRSDPRGQLLQFGALVLTFTAMMGLTRALVVRRARARTEQVMHEALVP